MIQRDNSFLMIIDFQERLVPAIETAPHLMGVTAKLIDAARQLSVPVIASEQYVKGLGPTHPDLAGMLEKDEIIEKTSFGCAGEPEFMAFLQNRTAERKQAILTGIEAHICVLQTALGLKEAGYDVYLVTDAVGSRKAHSKKVALQRMIQAGIIPVTFEMVLFEWLQKAATDEFRALRGLV